MLKKKPRSVRWWTPKPGAEDVEGTLPLLRFQGFGARAALETTRAAVKNLLGNVKPTHVPGRDERMRSLVEAEMARAAAIGVLPHPDTIVAQVRVGEGFGKPLIVTVDLVVPDPERELVALPKQEQKNLRGLAADLLDRVLRVLWDNDEVAPVAVRGRILIERDPDVIASMGASAEEQPPSRPGEVVVVDMKTLGFLDEIARSEDLYARLGPPAADPTWKP